MIKPGDRVSHRTTRTSFGDGTVVSVDARAGSALVEWDAHEVDRTTAVLSRRESHVNLTSLVPSSASRAGGDPRAG